MQAILNSAVAASLLLTLTLPAMASEEPTPTAQAPADRKAHMDPRHPFHIGGDYYPKQSKQLGEQGRCILNLYVNADGTVSAVQLLQSTGFRRLDLACFESVIDVPVFPAKENGVPVAGWSEFKINWQLLVGPPRSIQYPPLEKFAVPRVAEDYELHAGDKYYPETARAQHEKGYCVVHASVGSTGTVLNTTLTRSTHSEALDQVCVAAVKDARFTPELQDGQPVADSTDIAIYW